MKRLFAILLLSAAFTGLHAQSELLPKGLTVESYTDEFLDSLDVRQKLEINDYSMLGMVPI